MYVFTMFSMVSDGMMFPLVVPVLAGWDLVLWAVAQVCDYLATIAAKRRYWPSLLPHPEHAK
jgi:hypothetical protein